MQTNKQLVESHFRNKKTRIAENVNNQLSKVIERYVKMFESGALMVEEGPAPGMVDIEDSSSERLIRFPKIKITENWGKKNNEDREIFETLMTRIAGNTVEQKIRSVEEFLAHKEGLTVAEILSHLMFLEIFSNILEEFNPSVAGFLFEAFLAGLFQGVQIDDPVGGSLPIEDVNLFVQRGFGETEEIVPYSLKVLSPTTDLKGSFKNLVDFFNKEGNDSVIYLAVMKLGGTKDPTSKLKFFEFEINRATFFDWIGHENIVSKKITKELKFVPAEHLSAESGRVEVGNLVVASAPKLHKFHDGSLHPRPVKGVAKIRAYEEIPAEEKRYSKASTTATNDLHNLSSVSGKIGPGSWIDLDAEHTIVIYTGEQEWVKTGERKSDFEKLFGDMEFNTDDPGVDLFSRLRDTPGYIGNKQWHVSPSFYREMGRTIGELDLTEETLRRTAEAYASNLGESLIELYNSMSLLSVNVNKYFLASDKAAGVAAIGNANSVKKESAKLIDS